MDRIIVLVRQYNISILATIYIKQGKSLTKMVQLKIVSPSNVFSNS
jgi:hypothetical protein